LPLRIIDAAQKSPKSPPRPAGIFAMPQKAWKFNNLPPRFLDFWT